MRRNSEEFLRRILATAGVLVIVALVVGITVSSNGRLKETRDTQREQVARLAALSSDNNALRALLLRQSELLRAAAGGLPVNPAALKSIEATLAELLAHPAEGPTVNVQTTTQAPTSPTPARTPAPTSTGPPSPASPTQAPAEPAPCLLGIFCLPRLEAP